MSFPLVSPMDVIRMPFRRIYAVWAIVLALGFLLTGYGVGLGYQHWIALALIGFIVQVSAAPLGNKEHRNIVLVWGVLLLAGLGYTVAVMTQVVPFPTVISTFATPWLFLLGVGQTLTGLIGRQRIELVIGGVWVIISVVLFGSTIPDTTLYPVVAAVTSLSYLFIAFRRGL